MVQNIATVAAAIASVASQPRPFQTAGRTNACISCRRDAAIITATMIGTEMTALMTADPVQRLDRVQARTC